MAPEGRGPDDPSEWLRRARSNLVRARSHVSLPEICLEDLCFDAQQAVEKAVKALLISRHIDFPYTHSIERLLHKVEVAGWLVPEPVKSAEVLTRYATALRYPGLSETVSLEEYEEALLAAETVVAWVEGMLREEII